MISFVIDSRLLLL